MYKKRIIILVPFPFTDLSETKVRPAVVISDNPNGDDIVVSFISSKKIKRLQKTDIRIKKSEKTGLKIDSIIKIGKIATLDKKIVLGELGRIDSVVEKEIDKKIKILFGL